MKVSVVRCYAMLWDVMLRCYTKEKCVVNSDPEESYENYRGINSEYFYVVLTILKTATASPKTLQLFCSIIISWAMKITLTLSCDIMTPFGFPVVPD